MVSLSIYFSRVEREIGCAGARIDARHYRKDSLPPVHPQLANVKLKNPIEQQMMGHAGLFRQQNIERRKYMSVREWAELCAKDEMRAPGTAELDLHARSTTSTSRAKARRVSRKKARAAETAEPEIVPDLMVKEEQEGEEDEEGEGAMPPGTQSITLTAEENAAVDRLVQLGFSRGDAIQAYLACEKNEELAANFLFSSWRHIILCIRISEEEQNPVIPRVECSKD